MPPEPIDLDVPLAEDVPPAPHSATGEQVPTRDLSGLAPPARPARRWIPRRVVVTPAALDTAHGQRIVARVEGLGLEVERLKGEPADRRPRRRRAADVRAGEGDAGARGQPAVSRRRLQPIAPSADWRVRPGRGLPGALPVLLPRRLAVRPAGHPGLRRPGRDPGRAGAVRRRGHRPPPPRGGHDLRGVLLHRPAGAGAPHRALAAGGRALRRLGRRRCSCAGRPSTTTSGPFVGLPHAGRTRVRFSVNALAGDHPRGGRHGPARGPRRGAAPAGPGRLPGRADDRADHAGAGLARALRPRCSTSSPGRWPTSTGSTSPPS